MLESTFKMGLIFAAANNTSGAFNGLLRDVDKVKVKVGSLSENLWKLKSSIGKLVSLPNAGIIAGGFSFLKMGMDMEQTRLAFRVMVGDVEKANKVFNDLNRFADVTPFSNEEVLKAGKSLMAVGVPLEAMQQTMTSIGNVASGLNIPFTELSDIYGKIRSQGKMYGDDIRQLQGRGIPIIENLAKAMGVKSSEAIYKMVSDGKVLTKNFEQGFIL